MWSEYNVGNSNPYLIYGGIFPEKLYRYRSINPKNLDRLLNFEILEEGIFLAGLDDMNDSLEGRFIMRFSEIEV